MVEWQEPPDACAFWSLSGYQQLSEKSRKANDLVLIQNLTGNIKWSGWWGSNPRPQPWQGCALANWATPALQKTKKSIYSQSLTCCQPSIWFTRGVKVLPREWLPVHMPKSSALGKSVLAHHLYQALGGLFGCDHAPVLGHIRLHIAGVQEQHSHTSWLQVVG